MGVQRYTAEQLKNCSKDELIDLVIDAQNHALAYQDRLALLQANQFGSKSEKIKELVSEDQVSLVFNEAECEYSPETDESPIEEALAPQPETERKKKEKGKRSRDLSKLPHTIITHELSETELNERLGDGWRRLSEDKVYCKVARHPATYEVLEHHIAVYTDKKHTRIIDADHPAELLDKSYATPSLVADVMNMKYANAMPLNRISEEFNREGLPTNRKMLCSWIIRTSERHLSLMYSRLQAELKRQRVLQADETFVRVTEERENGRLGKSVMWAFRSGEFEKNHPVILFDYQSTRETAHPKAFLEGWNGILESDAFAGYKKLDRECEGITSAMCWAHARRFFADDMKIMRTSKVPEATVKGSLAYEAEKQIAAIYAVEAREKRESPEIRLKYRRECSKPLVDAFFAWCRAHQDEALKNTKVQEGIQYCLNQETYLRVFLEDGEVPIDNLASERAIKPFAIGRRNWMVCDSVHGAQDSAMIYSIVETAKANGLNPREYIRVLLEEIPKHLDDKDQSFLDDLLPWTPKIQESCTGSHKH